LRAGRRYVGRSHHPRTTATITEEPITLGISVSPDPVVRLLHQMGYSLRVNQNRSPLTPARIATFSSNISLNCFQRLHLPILSVDGNEWETRGNFRNFGYRWKQAPRSHETLLQRNYTIALNYNLVLALILSSHAGVTGRSWVVLD
jgi:hypothetical protein